MAQKLFVSTISDVNPVDTELSIYEQEPNLKDSSPFEEQSPFSDSSSDSDHLYTQHRGCDSNYTLSQFKLMLETQKTTCECKGYIKPNITFFGEQLPEKFHNLKTSDFEDCDGLIVIGTSLGVEPFCSLIDRVGPNVPRLLINREICGVYPQSPGESPKGFDFQEKKKIKRDAVFLGDCDAGVVEFCRLMGWEQDLERLINKTTQ